jgi:chromosomal replication initiator protein
MTTKLDSALWRDMMDYLRRRHAPICRQWFEELEPLELNSGLLRIHTTNQVQQNYLQRKCREQFMEAAQATTGLLLTVRFVTGEDALNPPSSLQAVTISPIKTSNPDSSLSATGNLLAGGNGSSHQNLTGRVGINRSDPSSDRQQDRPGYTDKAHTAPRIVNAADHADAPPPSLSRALPAPQSYSSSSDDDATFDQIVISPDYSFESFITGPGNQLAYAAAVAVANQPGTAYNPLFIHGGVGLGKTHLLQAICQTIMQQQPGKNITYLSCDAFMNQFLDCVQRGQMAEFRNRYRHADVLVIDDIHFLANRERTQEEFFHTFNALYQLNKQIVLSSDSPPNEIPQLEERLISRFGWGLVATVSRPCYETRVAIVRSKARIRALEISDDVVSYIASKIDTNARELEGAITTIQGHAALQNRPIDLPLAREALGESSGGGGVSQVTLQHIIDAVTRFYNVKLSDLQSKRRHKSITEPRQICMWLARKRTRFSLEEIGGYFGGRDHTTVMHSIRTVEDRSRLDQNLAQALAQLDEQIVSSR